ncbi:Na+/H+ antiporter NhaA [Aliarcobacter vitoriensis]|uniref:Na+/H+ antiporter NhaA n=1 Tax=Aliarcobacter vitoriensis TaxID=2011099 RepID=UPI001F30580C|nr:Na+/H+ antiporter NhaA [Aliarcobacter vitoriensis]
MIEIGGKIQKRSRVIDTFISKEALSGLLLIFVTVFAIFIANSNLGSMYFDFWDKDFGLALGSQTITMPIRLWINDGLMALFFLMVSLEIKREFLIGELAGATKALFPFVASLGGMIVPALVYIYFNPDNMIGFGIPMGTDTAFAIAILMLLGKRVNPLVKLFLVALAVIDDLGAILVVALVYTSELHLEYFIHVSVVYSLIWLLNYFDVKKLLPYLILGAFLWVFIHETGVHATIAGVLLAFAIPISSKMDEKDFIDTTKSSLDEFEKNKDENPILNNRQINALEGIAYGYDKVQNPLIRLEHNLHGFSAFFVMPIFAFSNAGVLLDFTAVTQHLMVVLGVALGLLIGKPLGIFSFVYIATKFKLIKKPANISWFEILSVGFIAGIGFTMSIFIANLAFTDEVIISAIKIGIFLASFAATLIGVTLIILKHRLKYKSK